MSRLFTLFVAASAGVGLMTLVAVSCPEAVAAEAAVRQAAVTPLEEFGEMVVGRWAGKLTMLVDWPGFGKKGDLVTGQVTFQWIVDRRALEGADYLGVGTNRALYFWDPAAKKIRHTQIDSGGTTLEGWIWKQNGQWYSKGTGSYADGTRYDVENVILTRDGGKSLVYKGTLAVSGGKGEAYEDVYTRASD
ncbi:MAG: hypothetical protein ACOX1P_05850 [Thermoguttaceae bacterium]